MKQLFLLRKYYIISLFVLIFSSITSCNQTEKENYEVISPLDSHSSGFSAKIIKTVPLSSEERAIIGKIDKLLIYKDYMYILDKRAITGLLIFSENGDFINKTQLGKGPGELVHPQSFNIIDNKIVISDQNLIKYYTLEGKYLSTTTLNDNFMGIWSFEQFDDSRLFIHGITKPYMKEGIPYAQPYHVINKDFSECYQSYLETSNDLLILNEENPICYFNERILVTARPYNYIYEFDGKDFFKKYYVDFGSLNFKKEDISQGPMNIISLLESGKRLGLLDNLLENKSFISFIYGKSKDIIQVVYSKKNHLCADFKQICDKLNLPKLTIHQLRTDDLVCTINPAELEENELSEYITQGILPTDVTLNSNPIVVFVRLIQ